MKHNRPQPFEHRMPDNDPARESGYSTNKEN
jgi:hypothetical protein